MKLFQNSDPSQLYKDLKFPGSILKFPGSILKFRLHWCLTCFLRLSNCFSPTLSHVEPPLPGLLSSILAFAWPVGCASNEHDFVKLTKSNSLGGVIEAAKIFERKIKRKIWSISINIFNKHVEYIYINMNNISIYMYWYCTSVVWERYVASRRLEACLHGPLQQHLWISQWKPMRGMSQFKGAQLKLAKYQMDSNGTCLCVCVWLCVTIKKSTITTSRVSSSPYGVHGISNHHTNPELRQFMQCSFKFGKPADLAGSHGDTVMECYGMLAIFVKPDSPELISNIKLITNINIQTISHEILNWGHLRWLWLTKILSLSGELRGGLFGSARGGGTTAWQTAWRNPGTCKLRDMRIDDIRDHQ